MKTAIDRNVAESLKIVRTYSQLKPQVAVILGSGLGAFADTLDRKIKIPTSEIPHYPHSTVQGHKGFLVFGKLADKDILAVQGRTHYYEGHDIRDVAYVVRLMAEIGVRFLLVTNAAGGVNPRFQPGDLMIIVDHINFLFRNPLRGAVVDDESRWTDMSDAYDREAVRLLENIGTELGIPLKKGVLFVSTGPTYETAAEVQMARRFGADAVSMSTVPEVLVAKARGMKVAGISCITNLATGISKVHLSHREVTEIANQVREKFQMLVREMLMRVAGSNVGVL